MATSNNKPSYTLHGRLHQAADISLPITRAEAAAIVKKWSAALKRRARGSRVYFILHAHRGRTWNRLSIETKGHRERKHPTSWHTPRFNTLPSHA